MPPPKKFRSKAGAVAQPAAPSVPLPQNAEQLEHLLNQLLAPDTAAIQQAEVIVKEFLNHPQSVAAMMQQVTGSQSVLARQMSAVLLRRHIGKLWPTCDASTRDSVKQALLQRLIGEPSRPVIRAIAQLISRLAKDLIPKNKWPALLDFLFQCSRSTNVDHREISMLLFSALTENIPKYLKAHTGTLQGIFMTGINDSEDRVRIAALLALEQLVDLLGSDDEKSVMALSSVVPALVNLVSHYLSLAQTGGGDGNEEEVISAVFRVFDTLADSPAPVLDAHIPIIANMMISVLLSSTFELKVREQAASFLMALVAAKPKKIAKLELTEPLFNAAIALMIENNSDNINSDDQSVLQVGADLSQILATNLPKKSIYTRALSTVSRLLASQLPIETQAGLILLGQMCEPMAEELNGLIESLFPVLAQSISHQHTGVRITAWVALSTIAEHIPTFSHYHHRILPVIFTVLSNVSELRAVREKATLCLETVCENIDTNELKPYLSEMITKLLPLINTQANDSHIIETSVYTLKLLADAAKSDFLPFLDTSVRLLAPMLLSTSDETLTLRCKATECLGYIAASVGQQSFHPYLQDSLQAVLAGFTLDFFELRESSYLFFASLAISMKDDFAPLLSTVLPLVLATLTSDDGLSLHTRGNGLDDNDEDVDEYDSSIEDEDLLGGDDDDEDAAMKRMSFSLRSGALDEKVAALACLCALLDEVNDSLKPYIQRAELALEELEEYPHAFVREGILRAYVELLAYYHRNFPLHGEVKQGEALQLAAEHSEMLDRVMHNVLVTMEYDDDRDVVDEACECLVQALKLYGIAAIERPSFTLDDDNAKKPGPLYSTLLHKRVLTFLREKAPCQRPTDEEEESEHDLLVETITDVMPAWARAGGIKYYGQQYFSEQLTALLKLTSPSRAPDTRGSAIGCIGDLADGLKEGLMPYINKIFPVVSTGLNDAGVGVRRNAAFAVGQLALAVPKSLAPHFVAIVSALEKLYYIPENIGAENLLLSNGHGHSHGGRQCTQDHSHDNGHAGIFTAEDYLAGRDNAASAIAKMITATLSLDQSPQSAKLVESWLPLMLQGLPLQSDQQEAKHVYPLIVSLYRQQPALIAPHTPTVLSALSQIFGHPEIELPLQRDLIAFCKALQGSENGAAVSQCVQSWPAGQQRQWQRFIIDNEQPQQQPQQPSGSQ